MVSRVLRERLNRGSSRWGTGEAAICTQHTVKQNGAEEAESESEGQGQHGPRQRRHMCEGVLPWEKQF